MSMSHVCWQAGMLLQLLIGGSDRYFNDLHIPLQLCHILFNTIKLTSHLWYLGH